jgi:hypothetical protein
MAKCPAGAPVVPEVDDVEHVEAGVKFGLNWFSSPTGRRMCTLGRRVGSAARKLLQINVGVH